MPSLRSLTLALLAVATSFAQSTPVVFENARIITETAGAPIEKGSLLIQNGKVVALGPMARIPAGATRIDLTGKTIIPAFINAHVHIGYEGYTSWSADNYTPANIVDHLQREAFYGVGATQTVGSSPTASSIQFIKDQAAGKFPPASRFFFMPGMAPPNGGPDAILLKGTQATHAVYEVSSASEARAAVQSMAAKNLKSVKIWVDDRRGTYPKMTPEVYNAVIDEAHKHHMLVQAHAIALEDQKAVVGAGADVLVHIVGDKKIDDELLALIRQHKPYWTPVMGLSDRSEVCNNDPFIDQSYPASTLASIRATSCNPLSANALTREEMLKYNFPKMIEAGARIVLGTDAGIASRHAFGWADHHELARYVELGLTPADALIAATSRPAAMIGISDMGTLAPGKSADFVILNANPLDDIHNTRRIDSVYLKGRKLDREALQANWKH